MYSNFGNNLEQQNMPNLIVDNAADVIIGANLHGEINYCNAAACARYGYTREEFIGMPYQQLLPKALKNEFENIKERLLFNETFEPFVAERVAKNGDVFVLSNQYSPIKSEEGRISGISCIQREAAQYSKAVGKSQAFLETAPDAMVIVNQFGQIVLVNAQVENLFGYTKSELLGEDVEVLIPDEVLSVHKKHRAKYFQQPTMRNMGQGLELNGKHKDGHLFPVEISLSPVKTDEGTFVSAAIRDITERKKAEKKFRGLLESAPDSMVIIDNEGFIQLVNTQTEKIFGYTKEELVGEKVEILIPKRFQLNHPKKRDGFYNNPSTRPMNTGLLLSGARKGGEEFPIEISLSPLEMEEGTLVSAAIRDITERIKAEQELKRYNEELKNKNKELEQFAYIASHDLQEPLRTVASLVDLLSEQHADQLKDEGQHFLGFIKSATQRMTSLINGLLEYSRIGNNRKLGSVDCNKLISNILADFSSVIKKSNAEFDVPDLPVIMGYETELRQLFQNLIHNAIKFRKPNRNPKISLSAKYKFDHWEFSIRDNGIGIQPKHQSKIFMIYQRLHSRNEYEGTGIGLSHCQKIVEMHKGKIWVESTPDEGSTFYFTISSYL